MRIIFQRPSPDFLQTIHQVCIIPVFQAVFHIIKEKIRPLQLKKFGDVELSSTFIIHHVIDLAWKVGRLPIRNGNLPAEFIHARQFPVQSGTFSFLQVKNEGTAVRVTAASRIPIVIGDRPHTGIFRSKALERGVDGLLLRTDKPHLHLPVMQGKDLGTKHGGIRYSDQLQTFIGRIVAGNDEKPGPVR